MKELSTCAVREHCLLERASAGMSDFKDSGHRHWRPHPRCGGKPAVRHVDAEEASPGAKAESRAIATKATAAASHYRALIYARHCVRTLRLLLSD